MRIALIATDCPLASADASGSQPGQHTLLARALAAHGHRVTVYVRRDSSGSPRTAILGNGASAQYISAGPARPVPADQAARYLPAFADHLAGQWRVRRPDVVHAFSWTAGLVALGAARGLDVPVFQTFESLGSAERRHLTGADVTASRVKIEASIGRAAATVLARSVAEADELARLGVPIQPSASSPAGSTPICSARTVPGRSAARGRS